MKKTKRLIRMISTPLWMSAFFFYYSSSYSQNMHTTDSLLQVLKTMPQDTNKVNMLRNLYNEYRYSDYGRASKTANEMLILSEKLNYTAGKAMAYRYLGNTYASTGNSVKAVRYYVEALRLYDQLKDTFFIAACYNNIGNVYREQKKLEKAIPYLKKAIALWEPLSENQEGVAIALDNLADIYMAKHQDTLALATYKKSVAKYRSLKDHNQRNLSMVLTHIGRVYLARKEYGAAQRALNEAMIMATAVHHTEALLEIHYYQSEISAAQHQHEKALREAKRALAFAQQIASDFRRQDCYLQLAGVYILLENYKDAVRFQSLYIGLHDSLNNVEQMHEVEQLQFDYQLDKKELLNQSLLKDKKIKEEEIARQQSRILLSIIILAILLATSFFYWHHYKKQKIITIKVESQRQEIHNQAQEIAAQNEEIVSQLEQISLQNSSLTKVNEAINKLFSVISHDLRAPFKTLEGVVSLMQNDLLTQQEMKTLSYRILDSITNASNLLDNLLLWSRTQMQGKELNQKNFDLHLLILECISICEPQAHYKSIRFIYENTSAIHVYADRNMIAAVIRNLLSNAIKFSDPNNVVCIASVAKEKYVQITVRDSGRGVSDEEKSKIFDLNNFYTTPGTNSEKGTGLGINLCQEYVLLNGGKIGVQSEVGKGSEFNFTLIRGIQ